MTARFSAIFAPSIPARSRKSQASPVVSPPAESRVDFGPAPVSMSGQACGLGQTGLTEESEHDDLVR
jgi:hypothetical protein